MYALPICNIIGDKSNNRKPKTKNASKNKKYSSCGELTTICEDRSSSPSGRGNSAQHQLKPRRSYEDFKAARKQSRQQRREMRKALKNSPDDCVASMLHMKASRWASSSSLSPCSSVSLNLSTIGSADSSVSSRHNASWEPKATHSLNINQGQASSGRVRGSVRDRKLDGEQFEAHLHCQGSRINPKNRSKHPQMTLF